MSDAAGQIVLVTGCSTGIGRALVEALREAGHHPVATARRGESVEALRQAGFEARELDVESEVSIQAAVEAIVAEHGRIDALINNAGFNVFGPLAEVPLNTVRRLFETNVIGLLAVCQAVFPHMAKAGGGRIVNLGSVVGVLPTPFAGAYCASKSAVHMLSDVLRMEALPFGIDVVVVQPGGVRSSISETGSQGLERYALPESYYSAAYEGIERRANASQDGPMETADFAREMVAAAFADPAPRVVRLGTGAQALPAMNDLPHEDRDAMLAARFDLNKLR